MNEIDDARWRGQMDEKVTSHATRISRLELGALLVLIGLAAVSTNLVLKATGAIP